MVNGMWYMVKDKKQKKVVIPLFKIPVLNIRGQAYRGRPAASFFLSFRRIVRRNPLFPKVSENGFPLKACENDNMKRATP